MVTITVKISTMTTTRKSLFCRVRYSENHISIIQLTDGFSRKPFANASPNGLRIVITAMFELCDNDERKMINFLSGFIRTKS